MKISPVSVNQYNTKTQQLKKQNVCNYKTNYNNCCNFSFCGIPVISQKDIPIKSFDEYKKVLDRIYKYKDSRGCLIFDPTHNFNMYPNIKKEEEGLLLYAGEVDLSNDINRFLSGRKTKYIGSSMAEDIVRVLDYSLDKLDKNFGTYKGIVYRQGFFVPNSGQYISTTTEPEIAASIFGGICISKNLDFYIIQSKTAHKMNAFQRKMNSDFAEDEEEIIISRKAKLEEVKNVYGDLLFAKNKFIKILESYARRPVDKSRIHVLTEI